MPTLLVCEEGSASDEEAKACRARFEGVAAEHWTYLPSFVDQYDDLGVGQPGDAARLRTVGVLEYRGEAVGWLDGSPADARFVAEFFGTA
jgi:hypothetical protein